jgi:hypothetical protein
VKLAFGSKKIIFLRRVMPDLLIHISFSHNAMKPGAVVEPGIIQVCLRVLAVTPFL